VWFQFPRAFHDEVYIDEVGSSKGLGHSGSLGRDLYGSIHLYGIPDESCVLKYAFMHTTSVHLLLFHCLRLGFLDLTMILLALACRVVFMV